jgi:hypothetical protein
MQPIYFLPNLRAAEAESQPQRPAILKARGLAEVFTGVPFDCAPCYELKGNGPGGLPGCVLCYQTGGGHIPKHWGQHSLLELPWSPIGDGSLLWLAVDPAERPMPEELARKRLCRGYDLELGDGQRWKVPVIRRPDGASYLPSAFVRDAAGRRTEKLRAEYQAHFDAFREAACWFYGGQDPQTLDREAFIDLSIRALSINYRYTANEQDVLQLVGQDNYLLMLAAAVDLPAFHETDEAAKKNCARLHGLSISPGPPAGSETTPTGPASPTSSS